MADGLTESHSPVVKNFISDPVDGHLDVLITGTGTPGTPGLTAADGEVAPRERVIRIGQNPHPRRQRFVCEGSAIETDIHRSL